MSCASWTPRPLGDDSSISCHKQTLYGHTCMDTAAYAKHQTLHPLAASTYRYAPEMFVHKDRASRQRGQRLGGCMCHYCITWSIVAGQGFQTKGCASLCSLYCYCKSCRVPHRRVHSHSHSHCQPQEARQLTHTTSFAIWRANVARLHCYACMMTASRC